MNFPPNAFPNWVTFLSKAYPIGSMGGAQVTDGTLSATMVASVQPPSLTNAVRSDTGDVQSEAAWWVYTATKAPVIVDDSVIYHEGALAPNVYPTITQNVFEAMTWRGDWSGSTAYVPGDVVRLNPAGGVPIYYYCILASTNHTPPNATYWAASRVLTARAPAVDAFDMTGVLWSTRCVEITH